MPKTIATFESSKFNTTQTKEHYINPESFGDDLAIFLADQLEQLGASIERGEGFPGQEDFGWYFIFTVGPDKYCLVIGSRPDENDGKEWVVWVERHCGFIRSVLGGRKRNISQEAVEKVHQAISSSSDISNIKWHDQKDFDAGIEENATNQP